MTKPRHAYHIEGLTDLSTFKKEAERRQSYQKTVIHHHKFTEDCDDKEHTVYEIKEK